MIKHFPHRGDGKKQVKYFIIKYFSNSKLVQLIFPAKGIREAKKIFKKRHPENAYLSVEQK